MATIRPEELATLPLSSSGGGDATARVRHYVSESSLGFTGAVITLSLALNVGGSVFARQLNGLLFLDTIGTAVAAIALGPWWGATVGAVTNLTIGQMPCKQQYFNYLIVNVVLGFYWGYFGRVGLRLFSAVNDHRTLLVRAILLGASGGLFASVLSLFTTFNFHWWLSQIDPVSFRRWHLTDEYYRWLLGNGHIDPGGTLAQILVRDVIAILPDKLVSVILAAVVIYYLMPRTELQLRHLTWSTHGRPLPGAVLAFVAVYGTSFVLLVKNGNISIDPSTCAITGRSFIPVQIVIWMLPLLWAMLTMILWARPRSIPISPHGHVPPRQIFVKAVYSDVLTILAGVFAVLIAFKGDPGAAGQIGRLLEDGLGMVAFFAVFGFVPGFVLRLLGRDPEREAELKLG